MASTNPLEVLQSGYIEELQESFDPVYIVGSGAFGLTQYVFWMIIAVIVTMVVVILAGKKLTIVPTNKFANMVEYGYERVTVNMGENAIGKGYEPHMPLLLTLFFFILVSNFIGLIPGCKTATGSLSVTWALSTVSFFYFNYCGVKAKGGLGYVKSIAPSGLPKVLVPVIWFFELVSLVLRWLTLAVRLYGNMFAGHMILGIFALMTSIFLQCAAASSFVVGLPSIAWFAFLLIMYALECLVAFLQAYVFTILSASYIGLATSSH